MSIVVVSFISILLLTREEDDLFVFGFRHSRFRVVFSVLSYASATFAYIYIYIYLVTSCTDPEKKALSFSLHSLKYSQHDTFPCESAMEAPLLAQRGTRLRPLCCFVSTHLSACADDASHRRHMMTVAMWQLHVHANPVHGKMHLPFLREDNARGNALSTTP